MLASLRNQGKRYLSAVFALALSLGLLVGAAPARAVSISLVDENSAPVTVGYRWVIEEDVTYKPVPGQPSTPITNLLATSFHKSYMPVVAAGTGGAELAAVQLDPTKHYFISVLPDFTTGATPTSRYNLGATTIKPGQASAIVKLTSAPMPTAQITIFVFHDNSPINNWPDPPVEQGLAGFNISIEEPGGRYGMVGGQVTADAFGNPLGTTYNPDASVAVLGDGVITTDADGYANIKNLQPGKYGIKVLAPTGTNWIQTNTIEGTKVIDAWVRAGEPPYWAEFAPPGPHAHFGFVQPMNNFAPGTGVATIEGSVVGLHLSRPPQSAFFTGGPLPWTTCWVGVNTLAGAGPGAVAQPCNSDGTFSIANVPPGLHQLVVWDTMLNIIFHFLAVTVDANGLCNATTTNGSCNLGNIPVFEWFANIDAYTFFDANSNGFPDEGEAPIFNVPVNLRFRDGTLYQSIAGDLVGYSPFKEVFPFFNWLVLETDGARFKATGATIVVDHGGPVPPHNGLTMPSFDRLNPQRQPFPNPNTGNDLSRTELGYVYTLAVQQFLGTTNVVYFGKNNYKGRENGGIAGSVTYAITRAENDPRHAAVEPFEPGIPRAQINLYPEVVGVPPVLADVDNYPFGWNEGGPMGPEDINRTGGAGFDFGSALAIVYTDSWDDSIPTGCVNTDATQTQDATFTLYGETTDCMDGMRNFNQVTPGVFDGAFLAERTGLNNSGDPLPTGVYIVEAVRPQQRVTQANNSIYSPPTPYQHVKEEDKNVDFGVDFTPSLLDPECVGPLHTVPAELTLFPGVEAPFAGMERPLCNMKRVPLNARQNAVVAFHMFTEVPISAHYTGTILNDLGNERDPNSPGLGEKAPIPYVPVSIRDWTGAELYRLYTDEFGKYNGLMPSTYTASMPAPTGVSPGVLTTCLNDPGPIPNPANPAQMILDPFFDRQYSQTCFTFSYLTGTTTYLDTPLIPVSAFAGKPDFPLDCELPALEPKIRSVNSNQNNGPVLSPQATGDRILTITSMGTQLVPNPLYQGLGGATPRFITRDNGFGNSLGAVFIGTNANTGLPIQLSNNLNGTARFNWTNDTITVRLGPTETFQGQLIVRSAGNRGTRSSTQGVTVSIDVPPAKIRKVLPSTLPGATPIQDMIDLAVPGDVVLLTPGQYDEMVILWKPVSLQGYGPGAVSVSPSTVLTTGQQQWENKILALLANGSINLLPGQPTDFTTVTPGTLNNSRGAGVILFGKSGTGNDRFSFFNGSSTTPANWRPRTRVDGINFSGAVTGGAIVLNGFNNFVQISNNLITNNSGFYAGGIKLGHSDLVFNNTLPSAQNTQVLIHNNAIALNGARGFAAGGGIALNTGSDDYQIRRNWICGNLNIGDGGGIGHLGLSPRGVIADNRIVFNQTIRQGANAHGGGIFVGGARVTQAGGVLGDTLGSGNVTIEANIIQGNQAMSGDGGAIALNSVNDRDAIQTDGTAFPFANWHWVKILDNFIVNNVAARSGGGIVMQDAARTAIVNNTVSHNDSTATTGDSFPAANPNQSSPNPAGIVSYAHSAPLAAAVATLANTGANAPFRVNFSNPDLRNNIIWRNRSYFFLANQAVNPVTYTLQPAALPLPFFADLAVVGAATVLQPNPLLNPRFSILSDRTGYHESNRMDNPQFNTPYFNGPRNGLFVNNVANTPDANIAFDEGGNAIDVRFGPLSLGPSNYHLQGGSPAINRGTNSVIGAFIENGVDRLERDIDNQFRPRPVGTNVDIGADEVQ